MATLPFEPNVRAFDPQREWRRAITIRAVAHLTHEEADQVAARLYGKEAAAIISKSAVAPADTSTSAWAGSLAATVIGPFLKSLRGKSGAAQLIEAGTQFSLARGAVTLPKLATAFPQAAWVAEGGPAPVFQGNLASTTLTPRKLVALSALTNELAERSAQDAETIISDLVNDSVALALDTKMFSADTASATAPAGLFNGISATAGTAGGGQGAMATDLKALTAAVAAAGGGGKIVIVAAPAQAMTLQLLAGSGFKTPVIVVPSLASGTVAVLDANAFASGFGAAPEITFAPDATAHFEDTSPQQIGTAGSPNIVAAPVRSAFQGDFKVLRCILRVGYAMRIPALAYTTTATW
ncbi:hypothetical protein GCM10022276_03070 [Sphingomonas limnosediminicola]|uniref:Phage capsid-like C-terminal domain-containing protein n=1 Tax=Sphingomonas limnosediminicola TaxID=940133 RepID=A0ABP7KUC9_9SPHN